MSVENAKKFGILMGSDEKVMAKVKEIGLENVDEIIEYAEKEYGLTFNEEDLLKLAEESEDVQELDEGQLEKLAGGTSANSLVALGMPWGR